MQINSEPIIFLMLSEFISFIGGYMQLAVADLAPHTVSWVSWTE